METKEREFDTILTGFGDKKIQVIKSVMELSGLNLKESKDLVEGVPSPLREGVSKAEAASIKKRFEKAGGTVEIKEHAFKKTEVTDTTQTKKKMTMNKKSKKKGLTRELKDLNSIGAIFDVLQVEHTRLLGDVNEGPLDPLTCRYLIQTAQDCCTRLRFFLQG